MIKQGKERKYRNKARMTIYFRCRHLGYLFGEIMKKILLLLFSAVFCTALVFTISTPVMADENTQETEEQFIFYETDYIGNSEFKTASFDLVCYTPMDFYGKTLRLFFQNVDNDKVFCIESESSEYKKGVFKAELPLGTYCLYRTTLDNDIYFNYQYSISPKEFTVSKDGIKDSEENKLVFAANKKKVVAEKNKTTFYVMSNIGNVEVQIGISGILEASYTDGTIPQRNIYLIDIGEDGIYSRDIAEGTYEVQSVQVYDEKKNPLHVYYKPQFTFGAKEKYFSLYVFSDEAPLQEEEKECLGEEGYILKKADEMEEYKNGCNRHIAVPKEALDAVDDTTYVDIESYLEKMHSENKYIEEVVFSEEEKQEMKMGDSGLEGDEISKEEKILKEFVSKSKNLQEADVTRKRFPFVAAGAVITALIFRFVFQKKNK